MRFPVSIEFKSSESASSDIQALFFSKVSLMGMIYFNAEYLFQFDVQGMLIGETSMGPLIKDYQIYTEKAEVQEYGDQYLLDIPYDVVSSYLLFGSGLNVDGTVSNATQVLGEFSTVAPLGGACSGNLTMVLSRDAYLHLKEFPDTLYMNCTMAFGPFSWLQNYTVAWTPPPAQSDTDSSPLPTDVDHSYVKSTGTPAAGGV